MKFNDVCLVSVLILAIGCSHPSSTRSPSSMGVISTVSPLLIGDVGVAVPDGEVFLYHRFGQNVVVKNCGRHVDLGATPGEARSRCQGKWNEVPLESFKQALKNLVNTDNLEILKPLTPEQVKHYRQGGEVAIEEVEKLQFELDRVNAFIAAYGPKEEYLKQKISLEKFLGWTGDAGLDEAVRKVNQEIDSVIEFITEDKLTVVDTNLTNSADESEKIKTQFMYTVLKQFDPNTKRPCGFTGTIEERIKDCSYLDSSTHGNFVLVTRTKYYVEVWKDTKSDLIWADTHNQDYLQFLGSRICQSGEPSNGLLELPWRLPTKKEFNDSYQNGMGAELPNMNHWFWTSTGKRVQDFNYYWVINGSTGKLDYIFERKSASFRCVAR